jgi:hypothetical protein
MDKVRLALVLVTVAITVGPILGIVLVYRDNLAGLFIPPEINQLMNGIPGATGNPGQPDQTGGIEGLLDDFLSNGTIPSNISEIIPEKPQIQYDPVTRTFTASFQMNNPSQFDMTLDSIYGTVECDEHHFPIGPMQLKNPVTLKAGESATVTITGQWSEDAIKHLETGHPGEQSVRCSLVGAVISYTTSFGMRGSYQSPEPISLGEVPLT